MTLEQTKEVFAFQFVQLMRFIDSERHRQLPSADDYNRFRRAYSSAYPDLCNAIIKSYKQGESSTEHPLARIQNANDPRVEALRQILLIIGAQVLKETRGMGPVLTLLEELTYQNEVTFPANVIDSIESMRSFLDVLETPEE